MSAPSRSRGRGDRRPACWPRRPRRRLLRPVVSPKRAKAAELQTKIAPTQTQIAVAVAASSSLAAARDRVKIADLYRLSRAMPDGPTSPACCSISVARPTAAGVSLQTIRPRTPTPAPCGGYEMLPISVDFQGRYGQLTRLLATLRGLVTVRGGTLGRRRQALQRRQRRLHGRRRRAAAGEGDAAARGIRLRADRPGPRGDAHRCGHDDRGPPSAHQRGGEPGPEERADGGEERTQGEGEEAEDRARGGGALLLLALARDPGPEDPQGCTAAETRRPPRPRRRPPTPARPRPASRARPRPASRARPRPELRLRARPRRRPRPRGADEQRSAPPAGLDSLPTLTLFHAKDPFKPQGSTRPRRRRRRHRDRRPRRPAEGSAQRAQAPRLRHRRAATAAWD